jgi:hypothetical protein
VDYEKNYRVTTEDPIGKCTFVCSRVVAEGSFLVLSQGDREVYLPGTAFTVAVSEWIGGEDDESSERSS